MESKLFWSRISIFLQLQPHDIFNILSTMKNYKTSREITEGTKLNATSSKQMFSRGPPSLSPYDVKVGLI